MNASNWVTEHYAFYDTPNSPAQPSDFITETATKYISPLSYITRQPISFVTIDETPVSRFTR